MRQLLAYIKEIGIKCFKNSSKGRGAIDNVDNTDQV